MPVFWWVELSLFSLMSRPCQVVCFGDVCELSLILGSLFAEGWVFIPVFVVWCKASSAGSSWHWGGAGSWIQTEATVRSLSN